MIQVSENEFVGDTDALKKDEKKISVLTTAGFVDLNADDQITFTNERYSNPFDRAFVPNPKGNVKAKEFTNSKLDVFRHPTLNAAEYRKRISDHLMIRFSIDVIDDDD
ncbi:MAG: hypothetical protein ACJ8C4_10715 [Gemmataceae bacterium]